MLWDKQTQTIVNNESADIIRMFNSAFDQVDAEPGDYYPEALREEIDQLNERIYNSVNLGIYDCGYATTQAAYDEAVKALFDCLDELEQTLSAKRYLTGSQITEADWRLFPTLVQFDSVYVGNFYCNIRRLVDYPNLWAYTRELYQMPGIAETVNFSHIKCHHYQSHKTLNPSKIVPVGPEINFMEPHNRSPLESVFRFLSGDIIPCEHIYARML